MNLQSRSPVARTLQGSKTLAIIDSVWELLAESGWQGLTMDGVAARAGVGKAALYRRWPSRDAMLVDLIVRVGEQEVLPRDTGHVRQDLLLYLRDASASLRHPLVRRIAPDVLAEMRRSPELQRVIDERFRTPRRAALRAALERGVERGELPASTDLELAMDVLIAPLFMFGSLGLTLPDGYPERLVDAVLASVS